AMIAVLQQASLEKIDSHRGEVVTGCECQIDQRAIIDLASLRGESQRCRKFVEGHVLDEADRLDTRQRSQAIEELAVKLRPRRTISQSSTFGCELEREYVRCLVSRIDILQAVQTSQQQCRTDEE